MVTANSMPRVGRGSSLIGVGLASIAIGVWTWYAEPACSPPPGPEVVSCVVEPLYPLAVLLILVGASLICIGSISLLRWHRREQVAGPLRAG